MGWPEDNKLKKYQHEASEHNKKVALEVLPNTEYKESHKKLRYMKTPEEEYLTGFGEMIK